MPGQLENYEFDLILLLEQQYHLHDDFQNKK